MLQSINIMIYIIGNWKSNKIRAEVQHWVSAVSGKFPTSPSVTMIVCPSYVHLSLLEKMNNLQLGVQTLSAFPQGAYTGAISASQVKGIVSYAILGHSERREYFEETDQIVAQQIRQTLEAGITPVIGVHQDNYFSQLSQLDTKELSQCLVMYEPPEAIGSGEAADPVEINIIAQKIKEDFNIKAVLYGGSVTSANITSYLALKSVSGAVVGSASLKPEEWIKMVEAAVLLSATKV